MVVIRDAHCMPTESPDLAIPLTSHSLTPGAKRRRRPKTRRTTARVGQGDQEPSWIDPSGDRPRRGYDGKASVLLGKSPMSTTQPPVREFFHKVDCIGHLISVKVRSASVIWSFSRGESRANDSPATVRFRTPMARTAIDSR